MRLKRNQNTGAHLNPNSPHTTPCAQPDETGGYRGGNPSDPKFQELITRWFQFGAFCPLFRLHGHRDGGPPSDECGGTNGDNEVWNLAGGEDTPNYRGIVRVMRLREGLRQYVKDANAETAATGWPMVRAMVLAFPHDPGCAGADVEDQFVRALLSPLRTHTRITHIAHTRALC